MTLQTLTNGDSETRTRDLYVANVSLSQLSYIPISLFIIARLTKNARKIQIRKTKKKSKKIKEAGSVCDLIRLHRDIRGKIGTESDDMVKGKSRQRE